MNVFKRTIPGKSPARRIAAERWAQYRTMTFGKTIVIVLLIFTSCKTAKVDSKSEKQKTEQTKSVFPTKIGLVNDFEKIFTDEEIKFLDNLLKYYKKTANRDIAVITISSLPEKIDFQQYAINLSEYWDIGKENDGNGLTIVLSKTLKKIRISTTDKTQNLYLPDEFCQKIIDKNMIPEFKKGNYYDGIVLGLNELIKKWM